MHTYIHTYSTFIQEGTRESYCARSIVHSEENYYVYVVPVTHTYIHTYIRAVHSYKREPGNHIARAVSYIPKRITTFTSSQSPAAYVFHTIGKSKHKSHMHVCRHTYMHTCRHTYMHMFFIPTGEVGINHICMHAKMHTCIWFSYHREKQA
jgi:hypothetical protein